MKDLSIMVDNVKFNYRVGLIIIKNNKILVEYNPKIDFVVVPGGRVKTLENSKDALKREIKEEMNIDLDINKIKLNGIIENFFNFNGNDYHELFFLYRLELEDNDALFKDVMINIDSEASYYKWIEINKLDSVKVMPVAVNELVNTKEIKHILINDLK